jgi:hypothetical protein
METGEMAVLAGCCIIKTLTCSSFLEGVIWLLLGTTAELTPVVRSTGVLTVVYALMMTFSRPRCSCACT